LNRIELNIEEINMKKAEELAKMLEADLALYDHPGNKEAEMEILNALKKLALQTDVKINAILNQHRKLGASDTQSREAAFSYFRELIGYR
jgi:hypothetical protein